MCRRSIFGGRAFQIGIRVVGVCTSRPVTSVIFSEHLGFGYYTSLETKKLHPLAFLSISMLVSCLTHLKSDLFEQIRFHTAVHIFSILSALQY